MRAKILSWHVTTKAYQAVLAGLDGLGCIYAAVENQLNRLKQPDKMQDYAGDKKNPPPDGEHNDLCEELCCGSQLCRFYCIMELITVIDNPLQCLRGFGLDSFCLCHHLLKDVAVSLFTGFTGCEIVDFVGFADFAETFEDHEVITKKLFIVAERIIT